MKLGNAKLFKHDLVSDHSMSCGGSVEVYIEPIAFKFRLLIFGAGHIGSKLAELANNFGFLVTVIDERTDIIDSISIDGINKINKNHKSAFEELVFDNRTFVASVSHLHEYDREIIAFCAKKNLAYLGMIGSKRKIATAKKIFTEQNILSEHEMSFIDWPMGVPIECQTPEEIVISILAKLIDVRGRKLKSE